MKREIQVRTTSVYLHFKRWYYYMQGHHGVGNPFRVYCIQPDNIKHTISSSSFDDNPSLFEIKGGDWDLGKKPANENRKLSMFKKHFEESIPWEETSEYHHKKDKIEKRSGRAIDVMDVSEQSTDVYDEYLTYMDTLYERIKKEGYKSQKELSADDDFAGRRLHPALNEIQVMIGRDGEFICNTGLHRLAIAKIQGVPKIPVRTQCRHTSWQKIRNELYTATTIDDLSFRARKHISHPELEDIKNESHTLKGF